MKDKHREFAAKLFGCSEESVTPEQREIAKSWSFLENYSTGPIRIYKLRRLKKSSYKLEFIFEERSNG